MFLALAIRHSFRLPRRKCAQVRLSLRIKMTNDRFSYLWTWLVEPLRNFKKFFIGYEIIQYQNCPS